MKLKRIIVKTTLFFGLVIWTVLVTDCLQFYEKADDIERFRVLHMEKDALAEYDTAYQYGSPIFMQKLTERMLSGSFCLASENESVPTSFFYQYGPCKAVYKKYLNMYTIILSDIKYFPVPEDITGKATTNFEDSWLGERTYGGKRQHEGTDIMASNNLRGYFPVISMTDGVVEKKGWLEQGGYRIGIRSPAGAYFYYAHLYRYEDGIDTGDTVKAGQVIGYMGDSGYSKVEGTVGKFDVHLHLGIYIDYQGEEMSVNPYFLLKYFEGKKKKFYNKS
ncbi:M23 family metallopeptidase [Anaeromicropila populeti]|uniref:Peptidase family M23 n=1 Tax=Anaeromicropila populeti TaxID=37658 RepID=A0A1I6KYT3_9FIRM|nr:M23 family metallopeptidase [Anaeromicropila populeti]SFR96080.1 Peptidase family M23 [Anaeromicropila populeti]